MRFKLLDIDIKNKSEKQQFGTYGLINGASHFILCAVDNSEFNVIDAGYIFEKIILYVTDLGLGTCWLGGTFNKHNFKEAMKLQQNEYLPAISPIGNIPKKRRMKGKGVRVFLSAKMRKSMEEMFFINDFSTPLSSTYRGKYLKALELIRLAPSAKNKQPWRVIIDENSDIVHFYIEPLKKYQNGVRITNFNKLDIGIAMCHLELTMNEEDHYGKWEKLTHPPNSIDGNQIYIISWIYSLCE